MAVEGQFSYDEMMKECRYWIYIMASEAGNLYIGMTDNLARRVFEHTQDPLKNYTKEKQCHKLIYFEEYSQVEEAIAREKQLKGWRREKKRWLVDTQNPGWRDLALDFHLSIK